METKDIFRYYIKLIEKNDYNVDSEELKKYFPLETVVAGMLEIYQRLLGLTFTEIGKNLSIDIFYLCDLDKPEVWHDEVSLHSVQDTRTGQTLGYFFMDLHPRDGKYGHAAMWNLQPGSLDRHGRRQKAVAAMVCNFPRNTATTPALLDHRQVQTLFHEFGHVMHGLVSTANISTFYGTNVERDFVEAPSQMLENWVWQKESLKLMSGHYKDNSSLPDHLLKKLVKSKRANEGGKSLRQMFYGTFDLAIHTMAEADTVEMGNLIYRDLLGIERINGTNVGSNFGHLSEKM